jgi:hypothetical protein
MARDAGASLLAMVTTVDEARRAVASDPDKLRRIQEFAKGLGLEG